MRQTGIALGEEVVRIAGSMKPVERKRLTLRTHQHVTELKYRYDLNEEKVKEFYVKQRGKEYFERLIRDRQPVSRRKLR